MASTPDAIDGFNPAPGASAGSSTTGGRTVRIGRNTEVRALGGGAGCLLMILVSIVLSVGLTVLVNLGR